MKGRNCKEERLRRDEQNGTAMGSKAPDVPWRAFYGKSPEKDAQNATVAAVK